MSNKFEHLLEKFLRDDLTPDELRIWLALAKDPAYADTIQAALKNQLESAVETATEESPNLYLKEQFRQMLLKAEAIKREESDGKLIELPAKRKLFTIRRIAVAASILLMLGLGGYFLFFNSNRKNDELVNTDRYAKDVKAPATNRAAITLADGQTIYLDSVANGQLALQGAVKLIKLANGQISYQPAVGSGQSAEPVYNTLNNPKGSKVIDIELSDGSHVWLNAGSSVTYPIAFVGNERKVEITGEAYFEITHDQTKPFIVSKSDMNVRVLGTKFNVNAYDDEANIKVTLLQGSVQVSNDADSKTIQPGEQAVLSFHSALTIDHSPDVEEVMAWKNGRFHFDGADINTVMRQLEKWYNVEIEYKATIPFSFVAKITRDVPVSEVLKLLELTGGVHFVIDGNKVIVMK